MSDDRSDLDPLLAPDSVAVVGASPDNWYSGKLVDNLLEYGYEGDVYLVNPGRDTAWGMHCYDDVGGLPETVDLVVCCVPRAVTVDVLREVGERGVPAALVITAGFAEADAEGEHLQAELVDVADKYDMHVAGPNCIGLANVVEGTVLTSTCSRQPEPGSIGLVSQSGALAFTTFFERAADEDVGFSHVVSTGNEAALSATDIVEYLGSQDAVDVVCAYVEGLDDPRRFVRVADDAARNGTPVLTVKVGRSSVAEAAILSHTGSVTGSDDAWAGAFSQVGVERVPDIPDLLGRAKAHAAFDPPASNRICIASTSGGMGSLLADMAAKRGLELPDIDDDTERALLNMDGLLTFGELHNPADIRGQGADVLPEITDVLFTDDAFDAYVFAIGLPAVGEDADAIADSLLAVADAATDPVFLLWTGRKEPFEPGGTQPYERVRQRMPLYYDPGRCMDAVASLFEAGENADRLAERPSRAALERDAGWSVESDDPDAVDAADATDYGIDLPSDDVLSWTRAARLLEAFGIDVHSTALATNASEAADAAADFGFPIVLKIDSPDVPHRTDADAVRVGLEDTAAVRDAYETIVANTRAYAPDARIEGVLVQPYVDAGVETLVGATRDDAFGPVVTVGSGGVAVELHDDTAVRLAPLSKEDAYDAIEATTLEERFGGYRGDPPRDVDALVDLLEAVGRLAAVIDGVAELDLNPVVVHEDGVSIVDVLVRTN
ncbi:acetate--CoA ligase family protein [Natronosalvus rutilus]|uniref:acetate--CoA ligase (ADP-forming) n=1 Tax=Natronosalvus rutilus TaxID=2953753 RepID=A0A9E7ND71_9EURY|nr:acetate--CoA ligase family protein [Natronosalvus rutilus]UTF55740.1 acetate--CoA ligase family protein [Natronosalvus rutilus]